MSAVPCRRHLLAMVIAVLVLPLLFPGVARGEDPFRLGSQIEDRVGALEGAEADVQAAIDDLDSSEQVQLWVAYVDSFSGLNAQDWADQTAIQSDLGLNDVLLAVAVEDRAYAYSVDQTFELDDGQMAEVMTVAVEPSLRENDWVGAAIGAANGMGQALRGETVTGPGVQPEEPMPSDEGGFPAGLVILLVVLAGLALLIYFLVRRARESGRALGGAGAEEGEGPGPSIEELRRWASAELVETDDAVKTSTDEVGFATAEFGEEQAEPFRQAVEEARRQLDEAFKLHRQVDEAPDEQRQRELLKTVLEYTTAANDKLDEQVERFDRLRDLEKDAPKVLDGLEGKLTRLDGRVPQVREELAGLAAVYSPAALAAVRSNPDDAGGRIAFSREQVQAGREELAAGRTGGAAVSSLAAEEAAAQAESLLDAVGRLGKDLTDARGRIESAIAETRRDIQEARSSSSAAGLASLVAAAEAAVAAASAAASPEGGEDPLASLRHLEAADASLEEALQEAREADVQRARAAAVLDRTVMAARAQIAAATDYITTHRGVVGSGPRTLLAQAQRDLDQALALAPSDPVNAGRYAAGAHEAAGRALSDAQSEVGQAMGGGMPGMPDLGGMGGSLAGAIIGGILTGGLMRGGLGGGTLGGGFGGSSSGFGGGGRRGGGGFAPPSFGGTGTRMRRGGGGRF